VCPHIQMPLITNFAGRIHQPEALEKFLQDAPLTEIE